MDNKQNTKALITSHKVRISKIKRDENGNKLYKTIDGARVPVYEFSETVSYKIRWNIAQEQLVNLFASKHAEVVIANMHRTKGKESVLNLDGKVLNITDYLPKPRSKKDPKEQAVKLLDSLSESERREILARYGISPK